MSADYLLKTEPSEYSFENLQRDVATVWDGVSNPTAVKNLREMTPGTRLVIYETGDRKSAVGTATVVSVNVSDPRKPKVTVKAGKALAKPITLAEIKANKLFRGFASRPHRKAFGRTAHFRSIQGAHRLLASSRSSANLDRSGPQIDAAVISS